MFKFGFKMFFVEMKEYLLFKLCFIQRTGLNFLKKRSTETRNEKIPMLIQRLRISNVILMFSIELKRNILTKWSSSNISFTSANFIYSPEAFPFQSLTIKNYLVSAFRMINTGCHKRSISPNKKKMISFIHKDFIQSLNFIKTNFAFLNT
jgi:hypothetical protein